MAPCPGCGAKQHPGGRRLWPAFKQVCFVCQKTGHFAKVCRSRQEQLIPPRTLKERGAPRVRTSLVRVAAISNPAPSVTVQITSLNGSTAIEALPDSGADISAAGTDALRQLGEHELNLLPSLITPRAANGTSMRPMGKIPVTFKLGSHTHVEDLHIYRDMKGVLLSWRVSKGLHILPQCYPEPVNTVTPKANCHTGTVNAVVCTPTTTAKPSLSEYVTREFPTVFDGQIKTMEGEQFNIALTDDAKPFCINTPRSIPFAYRDKLKDELDILQSQGIIELVTEPTEWCAPIVVAPKKDTTAIRMCVDLSRLNRYIRRERYQSQTPAQAVADIAADKARIFTKLDAMKGYHQCPLDPESQLLMTFITPFGRFKFLRAPYGISSISEHYNRRMDEAFAGLTGY